MCAWWVGCGYMCIYLPYLWSNLFCYLNSAIKVPPTNYFNTLRGAWSDFYGPSGLLQFGRFGPSCLLKLGRLGLSCLGPTFFMGRVVLGRLVFGPSCPEPEFNNLSRSTFLQLYQMQLTHLPNTLASVDLYGLSRMTSPQDTKFRYQLNTPTEQLSWSTFLPAKIPHPSDIISKLITSTGVDHKDFKSFDIPH